MNEALLKFSQRSLWDTPNATGSVGLPDGPLPCVLPESQTTSPAGQGPRLAKASAVPESKKAKTTNAISGPKCSGSSASVSLQSCLESKCRQRFDLVGSMEYRRIWKARTTPLGRSFLEHTASAARISDKGSTGAQSSTKSLFDDEPEMSCDPLTGWPTPVAQPAGSTPEDFLRRKRESVARGNSMGVCLSDLGMVAQMAGWPTPTSLSFAESHQPGNNRSMNKTVELASSMESPAGWVTPSTRDWKDTAGMSETGVNPDGSIRERMDQLPRQVHGLISESSPVATARTGVLDAAFPRWLQGFPETWCECAPHWKEWDTVQKKLTECAGDLERFSHWLVEIALGDSKDTATP